MRPGDRCNWTTICGGGSSCVIGRCVCSPNYVLKLELFKIYPISVSFFLILFEIRSSDIVFQLIVSSNTSLSIKQEGCSLILPVLVKKEIVAQASS